MKLGGHLLILWCSCLMGSFVWGVPVPSPNDLLRAAKQDRAAFLETVSDLNRVIPDIDNKEDLFAYLLVLDEVEEQIKKFDFSTVGSDPMKILSQLVTRNGAKWVYLDDVTDRILECFLRRSEDNVRFDVINQQLFRIYRLIDAESQIVWLKYLSRLQEICSQLKTSLNLYQPLDDLQAQLIKKMFLPGSKLTENQLKEVLVRDLGPSAWQELLDVLSGRLLKEKDPEELDKILLWLVLIQKGLTKISYRVSLTQLQSPGGYLLPVFFHLLELDRVPVRCEIKEILDALTDSQRIDLADSLNTQFAVKVPKGTVAEYLKSFSSQLVNRLQGVAKKSTLDALLQMEDRLVLSQLVKNGFEGSYDLELESGIAGETKSLGKLTVIVIEGSRVVIGMMILGPFDMQSGFGNFFNFFDVSWSSLHKQYLANYRRIQPDYLGLAPEEKTQLKFILKEAESGKKELVGTFLDSANGGRSRTFRAVQVDKFPYCPRVEDNNSPSPNKLDRVTGTYRGVLKKNLVPLEVSVIRSGAGLGGNYFLAGFTTVTGFEFGVFDEKNQILSLTTGEFSGTRQWFQFRGKLSDDGLKWSGVYIRNGTGIESEFELTKLP
jgi:hypothetical protein